MLITNKAPVLQDGGFCLVGINGEQHTMKLFENSCQPFVQGLAP
jgi:SOS-response transcriptional repressor LexA